MCPRPADELWADPIAQKWIARYEKKSKCVFDVGKDEHILYNPEHGILGYELDGRNAIVIVTKLVGNGKYWGRRLAAMMDALRREVSPDILLCAQTKRDPKAYQRRIGGEIIDQQVRNGEIWYFFTFDWNNVQPSFYKGWEELKEVS